MCVRLRAMILFTGVALLPQVSLAHVKWFSRDADCTMPPLTPMQVVSSTDFLTLAFVAVAAMALAAWVDTRISRQESAWRAGALWLDRKIQNWVAPIMRWAVAAFFLTAVWYYGSNPVFLTPELKAHVSWVRPMQLSVAILLLNRRSAWLGGLGIAALYCGAVAQYGWFHLLDYPVFLGVACFIVMDSLYGGDKYAFSLAVLRVTAGVTLMWGGAEKWMYPWWSYAMLEGNMSAARMGFSPHFFMTAAGYIEFCAAFSLAFGRYIPQIAAFALLVPFVAAIPVFGALDAIGHAPIIVVLILLTITHTRVKGFGNAHEPDYLRITRYVLSASFSALGIVGVYWGLHNVAYGRASTSAEMKLISALLVLPLLCWLGSQQMSRLSHAYQISRRRIT